MTPEELWLWHLLLMRDVFGAWWSAVAPPPTPLAAPVMAPVALVPPVWAPGPWAPVVLALPAPALELLVAR